MPHPLLTPGGKVHRENASGVMQWRGASVRNDGLDVLKVSCYVKTHRIYDIQRSYSVRKVQEMLI